MLHVKEAPAVSRKILLCSSVGSTAQHLPSFSRGVVEAKHGIAQSVHIEVIVVLRQFNSPPAYGAQVFERQISFVVKAELKEPGIVLPSRGGNGFPRSILTNNTRVVQAGFIFLGQAFIIATFAATRLPLTATFMHRCA